MRSRGYTVVELLVVVGIIAILAAMIAPVLLQAKESSRMRVCANNLRQLGQAIWRYMDDHNGFGLPQSPPQCMNPWVFWPGPLCPDYIGEGLRPLLNPAGPRPYKILPGRQPKCLWICPCDILLGSNNDDNKKPCWWLFGSSYLYPGPTAYLRAKDPSQQNYAMAKTGTYPCKVSSWKNHRRDILLADFYFDFHCGTRAERYTEADVQSLNPPMYIKLNTVNVLFLDMHMRAVTPEQRKEYQDYTTTIDNPYVKLYKTP